MFESMERGTISELLKGLTEQKLRGEHVVVIGGVMGDT
jgi:16S rRNA C1402 (ribose-2'-O) methylase RsmI